MPGAPESRIQKISNPGSGEKNLFKSAAADLFPGYFALVMATGIVSLSAHFLHFEILSVILFWLNLSLYALLWILLILRLVFFRSRIRDEFRDPGRGVGFFTVVAATCILGSQASMIGGDPRAALALFIWGAVLWAGLIYGIFTALVIPEEKPSFVVSLHGSWLISVVGTQSVAVLAGINAENFHPQELLFLALVLFLIGGMLYLILITLIFYRLLFLSLSPADLVPSYWINMGAAAITTLAGAGLVLHAPRSPLVAGLLHFILGLTIFFWAAATWWIPFLTILWIWRHGFRRLAVTYHPQYWSLVFPLGMYTACTFQLSRIPGMEIISPLPHYFIYVALAAWVLTFIGLIRAVLRKL